MLPYIAFLYVGFCYMGISYSQETSPLQVLNKSETGSLRKIPLDYDYPQSNLWLISRDDPIPMKLNGQWSIDDAIANGRGVSVGRNAYGRRLSNIQRNDDNSDRTSPFSQLPTSFVGQEPAIFYDRTVTAENRRHASDESQLNVQNPEAVIVELPIEVTAGLWVQPQQQQSVTGRRNIPSDNGNIRFDGNTGKTSDVATAYLPARGVTSRLPNSNVLAEGEVQVPLQQYYEAPVLNAGVVRDGTNSINISFGNVGPVAPTGQGFWLLTQEEKIPTIEKVTERRLEGSPNIYASDRQEQVHDYGNVLTAEDIELLEKLGILSSFIIEPISQQNTTNNFTGRDSLQREYEGQPAFIDNGGQNYFANTQRENTTFLSDVVLIDVPLFSAGEYHSNIPENAGIDHNNPRISPFVESQTANSQRLNNSESKFENSSHLSDRDILEILQVLGLNTGDLLNLSVPVSLASGSNAESDASTVNKSSSSSSDNLNSSINSYINREDNKQNADLSSPVSTSSTPGSNNETQDSNFLNPASQPTVTNSRIQPRLLEKPVLSENEIMSRFIQKAVPASSSKLGILKKIQIPPQPYFFGFRQNDGNGTFQHRNETSDAKGVVKGSYGYRDAMGVYRNVSYIADKNGFHAVVKTNEPGTVSHNTADAVVMSETPPLAALLKMMAYRRPRLFNATAKP